MHMYLFLKNNPIRDLLSHKRDGLNQSQSWKEAFESVTYLQVGYGVSNLR